MSQLRSTLDPIRETRWFALLSLSCRTALWIGFLGSVWLWEPAQFSSSFSSPGLWLLAAVVITSWSISDAATFAPFWPPYIGLATFIFPFFSFIAWRSGILDLGTTWTLLCMSATLYFGLLAIGGILALLQPSELVNRRKLLTYYFRSTPRGRIELLAVHRLGPNKNWRLDV